MSSKNNSSNIEKGLNLSDSFDNKQVVTSLIIIVIAILCGFSLISYKNSKFFSRQEKKAPSVVDFVPKRIEYKDVPPQGFLASIPVEKGTVMSQSYIKEYKDQKQMSVVFSSKKTVTENLSLYQKFLKTGGWKIASNRTDSKGSYLYGKKETYSLDIMILKKNATSTPAIKSYVVMSLLKK